MEDELLKEFLSESREHLTTIEADLLAIEEAGANIDEERVNKVFRAAHSIKGGSSFLGLSSVKDLAHKAETVLDMLRTRKMTPNAEVVNVLLAAFDKLREMINNPVERDKGDISDLVAGLTNLASSYLPKEQKGLLTRNVSLQAKGDSRKVTLPEVDFERARRSGQCVYAIDYDLIHDIEKKGLNVLRIFRELAESGEILDCALDFETAGTLDEPTGNRLPLRLILASTLAPELMPELVLVPQDRIQLLFDPAGQRPPPAVEPARVPAAAPAPAPSPAPQPRPVAPPAPILPPTPVLELNPAPFLEPEAGTPLPIVLADSGSVALASEGLAPAESSSPSSATATADDTLRVRVDVLETLMNLAGELVLGRNQLRSAIAQQDQEALAVADQRINQATSELQDAIMRTRLQPIGNVFGKLPRIVRDLGAQLRKEIQLDIYGKDVALDRSLIEGLSDPLTHMVRNAVDHGIESPNDRLQAGKRPQGRIRIEARHEAGQVVVEISDDGKGIDPARVSAAALAKGLITPEKLRGMSDHDRLALIMLPGLSTAKTVTDVSGRGVGMDVVRSNLEKLGGQMEISSEIGRGSTFRIKLPLTLAIIPSLIISMGTERFALPQINVSELLRVRPEDAAKRLEVVGDAQVLLLRDQVLPLVRLDTLLQGREAPPLGAEALEIVVVTTGSRQYALVVGSFHETEEIVVKPLGRHLKGLSEYAGATILGDGAVALILDVAGVAAKAGFGAGSQGRETSSEEDAERKLEDIHSLLQFHNAPEEVCAVPLGTVLRIERVTPKQVERVGSRRTIQYRGTSLPLVTLADAASVGSLAENADLAVIVFRVNDREVGLLGAMPVDVVESEAEVDQVTHRQKGVSGSAIIRSQTTLLVDVFELVEAVYPEWARPAAPVVAESLLPGAKAATRPRVLLAEDSDFFRAQIRKFLEQDGFEVLEAVDGEAAWESLQAHSSEIRAVVTDIEMPRLTGLGLTARIRGTEQFAQLPVIALSSLAGEDDVAKGMAAGVNQYQVKLDRDRLLAGVHECVGS